MEFDWRKNDALKNCSYCGNPVKHGSGWTTVGLCEEHERIWKEDIQSGFKRNRLREIMVARGEVQESSIQSIITKTIKHHENRNHT